MLPSAPYSPAISSPPSQYSLLSSLSICNRPLHQKLLLADGFDQLGRRGLAHLRAEEQIPPPAGRIDRVDDRAVRVVLNIKAIAVRQTVHGVERLRAYVRTADAAVAQAVVIERLVDADDLVAAPEQAVCNEVILMQAAFGVMQQFHHFYGNNNKILSVFYRSFDGSL